MKHDLNAELLILEVYRPLKNICNLHGMVGEQGRWPMRWGWEGMEGEGGRRCRGGRLMWKGGGDSICCGGGGIFPPFLDNKSLSTTQLDLNLILNFQHREKSKFILKSMFWDWMFASLSLSCEFWAGDWFEAVSWYGDNVTICVEWQWIVFSLHLISFLLRLTNLSNLVYYL